VIVVPGHESVVGTGTVGFPVSYLVHTTGPFGGETMLEIRWSIFVRTRTVVS
jgi:hypothetical protein